MVNIRLAHKNYATKMLFQVLIYDVSANGKAFAYNPTHKTNKFVKVLLCLTLVGLFDFSR